MAFCLGVGGVLGIADPRGSFASTAWCISDDLLNRTSGEKFGWFAPDGNLYIDHRDNFTRPTEDQIRDNITPELKAKALELGLIELTTEKASQQ